MSKTPLRWPERPGGSHHVAWRVELRIGFAQRGDDPFATALRWAEADEEHLIFRQRDHVGEFPLQRGQLGPIQVALEDGELEMYSVILADAEGAVAPLVFRDVVANEVGVAQKS